MRSRAWAHAEKRAAKALGGRRHVRTSRLESAPDVVDVPGWAPEVKYRKALPKLVTDALRQAQGYAILGQRPVAILFQRGAREAIACVRLQDFVESVQRADETRSQGD